MNKTVGVIRHISVEGLGSIEDVLKSRHLSYRYIDTWKDQIPPDISDYSALIILGGPMGVYETDKYPFMEKELSLIRKARDAKQPVIGVCLGSQMIAQALGGRVYKGSAKEIGWYDIKFTKEALSDRLFNALSSQYTNVVKVFQWHGDTFDLPDNAVLLASSALYPNQAFKVDNIYGLQFHIEVKDSDIKSWIREYKTEIDTLKTVININKILDDTRKYIDLLNTTSINMFTAFFSSITAS